MRSLINNVTGWVAALLAIFGVLAIADGGQPWFFFSCMGGAVLALVVGVGSRIVFDRFGAPDIIADDD
jgi:hypothetical protein